jgi:hypothetical protein
VTTQSLAAAVEQRLKRTIFVERDRSDLLVEIRLAQSSEQIDVEISLSTETGQSLGKRSLSNPNGDCSKLHDSLSLVLALMVDLNREEVQTRSSEVTRETRESTHLHANTDQSRGLGQPKTTPAGPIVSRPEGSASRWILSLGGFSLLGALPELAYGARGAVALHGSTISEELGIAVVFPVTSQDGTSGKAEFSQYLADGSLCSAPFARRSWEFRLCGGLELGITRAQGSGYLRERTAHLPVLSPSFRTDSTWWPTSRFGLRLGFGAKAPVYRDRFFVVREDGSEHELFRPAFGALFLQADVCMKL